VQKADEPLTGRLVTVDNYGLVADDLRRELRVAQVVCLST
jgi:serine protease Do